MLDPAILRAKFLGPTPGTVLGYHATNTRAARTILRSGRFRESRNPYDWLGDGVYFWEAAPERAWEWAHSPRAQRRLGPDIAIVGARIHLDRCIDFHDVVWHDQIKAVHDALRSRQAESGRRSPRQTARGEHGWDREVINRLADLIYRATGITVGVVRASFREPEDEPLFGGSALYRGAHVQLAVRDQWLIEAHWLERGSI
jgi:hypothetical protein